jgi:hypothetical protein
LKKSLHQIEKALDQLAKTLCHLKKALDQLAKTLCHLKKSVDQLMKTLRHLKKSLRQLAKTLDQMEKALCQKTKPLCKESKTPFPTAKPLCRTNGRNSSSNPPTHANPKTTVQPHHQHQHGRIAMVNTNKSTHRPTVALSLPKKVPALLVYAQGIVDRLTGNPSFPTPTPTLAALIAAIHELQAAADASWRTFAAKPGHVSGVATVVATSAARRASYEWQYSIDGGKTWVTGPATLQAETTVAGLVPGSTVQFKYRAVTKTGEGDWSQPVSLMVH